MTPSTTDPFAGRAISAHAWVFLEEQPDRAGVSGRGARQISPGTRAGIPRCATRARIRARRPRA
jgi:hypothetical protein